MCVWSRVLYCCVFMALIVSPVKTIVPINTSVQKAGKPRFQFLGVDSEAGGPKCSGHLAVLLAAPPLPAHRQATITHITKQSSGESSVPAARDPGLGGGDSGGSWPRRTRGRPSPLLSVDWTWIDSFSSPPPTYSILYRPPPNTHCCSFCRVEKVEGHPSLTLGTPTS